MTTIAYRDGIIASDTKLQAGGSSCGDVVKIAGNSAGDLAGGCGSAVLMVEFLEWFRNGEQGTGPLFGKVDKEGIDEGKAFIARATGEIQIFESTGSFECAAPYYAIGSGRGEALGAMHAGADAAGAVRAAMAHDCSTGGRVVSLSRVVDNLRPG